MVEGVKLKVRLLPGGSQWEPVAFQRDEDTVTVDFGADQKASIEQIQPGSLVEIVTPEEIYLGPVLRRSEGRLLVDIEHVLDQDRLRSIQARWGLEAESNG
jgi:hypothetical protein